MNRNTAQLKALQTPFFLIDRGAIENNLRRLRQALLVSWGKNCIIGYSYKANALPWVVEFFSNMGCYAEVSSADEFCLAGKVGNPPGRVIYNGVIKSRDSFETALRSGAMVNIETDRELDWLRAMPVAAQLRVGVRVNFDLEQYCRGQSQCGMEGGRFGFCLENGRLHEAIAEIRRTGAELAGLQLHCSTKTRSVEVFETIADMACRIAEEEKLRLRYVDVGGGFFGGMPDKPQFEEYAARIAARLKRRFLPEETALVVEPGMALIGPFVSYHTSVIDVKDNPYHRFVVTDGSRTCIDPLMHKTGYQYRLETDRKAGAEPHCRDQVICGYTCMENDRLFTAVGEPELRTGDRIVFERVGAYTMSLTPLFIQWFPDVYVTDGHEVFCARPHWGVREYIGDRD